jgi:tRNA(fMet)-specific endonuclease VapC
LIYFLDTNVCIALINGRPASVRIRFQKVVDGGAEVNVSTVAAFELWYGVGKSQQRDAKVAGKLRAEIEATGRSIGAYDLLIAGQTLRHQGTLVTTNIREFARVKGLLWEDWAKS